MSANHHAAIPGIPNKSQADEDFAHLLERKETSVTDPQIINEKFLTAIFGNVAGNPRPLICGFRGHPGKVSSGQWVAHPWKPGETTFDAQANNYFTLSIFKPDSEGKYRRQKKTYVTQHALMLDDIGTKVELALLTLPPSWLLETSPGNFQAGYIFSEPIVDGKIVELLMKAIIAAKLCDPGADGPLTRCARLPVGINGKHNPPFKQHLKGWHPQRRYNIQEIRDGFGLDFSLGQDKQQGISYPDNPAATGDDRIYIPRSPENPVIKRLKEQGLYIRPLGEGKYEIKCPWQHEHTNAEGGGCAYWEPKESSPNGGFKCLHGHCKKRHMRELREYLGVSKIEAANRPTIRLRPGFICEIIDHFEQELARIGWVYQRAGIPVYIGSDPGTKETTIRPLSVYLMIRVLSRYVNFVRFDNRSKGWICYDPPYSHCRNLYESGDYPHLPPLHGITWQPYLRIDGSLMASPGYDVETGLFGEFKRRKFVIPDEPSQKEAEDALKILNSLLDEFIFKTEHDRAAALAAILTATIRSSLPLAPMFLIGAHVSSSGKSYLTALISAFATKIKASGATFPSNDDECQKVLLASLMNAPSVLCFDNCMTDIFPYKALCSALTEEFITGRILGFSKMMTVSTRILFLSSGNNINPAGDMNRRVISSYLDPACETPAARKFKNEPVAMVHSRREYYVSLALTVIRAWIVAGRPITEVKPVATYTDWSNLCRQPLLWLGWPDPAHSIFHSIKQDPDREILGRLLHAWYENLDRRPTTIRDATNKANHELLTVFMDIAGDHGSINNKRLGKWISRHSGRIVDGLKFEKDSSTRSAEAWRVISV